MFLWLTNECGNGSAAAAGAGGATWPLRSVF